MLYKLISTIAPAYKFFFTLIEFDKNFAKKVSSSANSALVALEIQCNFNDQRSIGCIVKSFYQISLT